MRLSSWKEPVVHTEKTVSSYSLIFSLCQNQFCCKLRKILQRSRRLSLLSPPPPPSRSSSTNPELCWSFDFRSQTIVSRRLLITLSIVLTFTRHSRRVEPCSRVRMKGGKIETPGQIFVFCRRDRADLANGRRAVEMCSRWIYPGSLDHSLILVYTDVFIDKDVQTVTLNIEHKVYPVEVNEWQW